MLAWMVFKDGTTGSKFLANKVLEEAERDASGVQEEAEIIPSRVWEEAERVARIKH